MVYNTASGHARMQPQMVNFSNRIPRRAAHATLRALCLVAALLPWRVDAQTQPVPPLAPNLSLQSGSQPGAQAVPGFWDPRRRPERPDLSRLTVIRFLTETDYPPFNYTGPDGNPAGFNVDLARALCEEIKVTCTIQMRRFETLLDAIASNRGDAITAPRAASWRARMRC
jgi:polar amino acid transport system substrate-binding protein